MFENVTSGIGLERIIYSELVHFLKKRTKAAIRIVCIFLREMKRKDDNSAENKKEENNPMKTEAMRKMLSIANRLKVSSPQIFNGMLKNQFSSLLSLSLPFV